MNKPKGRSIINKWDRQQTNKCVNCHEELNNIATIKTKDGFEVCSNWCKSEWELDIIDC